MSTVNLVRQELEEMKREELQQAAAHRSDQDKWLQRQRTLRMRLLQVACSTNRVDRGGLSSVTELRALGCLNRKLNSARDELG